MLLAAVAAGAGGCVLVGWLAALLWRAPAERRARAELELLRQQVDAAARRGGELAALERLRANLEEAGRQQAELRARVAEDEALELRLQLEVHQATPCVRCGLPLPLCPHGAAERDAWLLERRATWDRLHLYR